MPTVTDFELAFCLASMYTPDAEVSSARALTRLLPLWASRFDADPTTFPVPEGLPREVPRVILQSRSGQWSCEIASARINIVWRKASAEAQAMRSADFYREATPILLEYRDFLDSRVGRLAALINRYTPHPAPAQFLVSHFCKERWLQAPFNRPASFELNAHKTFLLAGRFQVNSWVRNKTGTLTEPSPPSPIVIVEQDLNTPAEEMGTREFPFDEIAAYFEAVAPGFDETLSLYYPPDERA